MLQGDSEVLNLVRRWEDGRLGCHDPATGRRIATFHNGRARAEYAATHARDLEAELRPLRGNWPTPATVRQRDAASRHPYAPPTGRADHAAANSGSMK